jgi:hypothetical protein
MVLDRRSSRPLPAAGQRRGFALTWFAALALAGCGGPDEAAVVDASPEVQPDAAPVLPPADDRYTDPADFPRDGCAPGGFDGVAAEGIYHLVLQFAPGFSVPIVIRLDDLGGRWDGLVNGRDGDFGQVTADDVIVHWSNADGYVRSVNFCARAEDGTVTGTYASCNPDQDPACNLLPVTGRRVDRLAEPDAAGLTLLGELAWPVSWPDYLLSVNVRVADGIAYVARYRDGLRIVDVSDPAAPREVGHVPTDRDDEIWNDVKLADGPGGRRYALMGSNVLGAAVVDVTDPATAAVVAHFGSVSGGRPPDTHTLFVDGGKAYLANSERGLEIWDIADPAAAVKLGQFTHPRSAQSFSPYLHDLSVFGDRAYLNYWDLGMAIVDVSNPATPALVGEFRDYGETTSHSSWVTQVGGRDIAVHGDEQYGSHVHIVDVTEGDAAFGNVLAEWETRPEVSAHNIMASGSRAFVAYYQDGIRVLDLSNPSAPVQIAHYNTWPGYDPAYGYNFFEGALGIDLDLAAGRIYVADSHRGLLVLQLESQ